jgi:hypothetical protein
MGCGVAMVKEKPPERVTIGFRSHSDFQRDGDFVQFVFPLSNGHVPVCIEPDADPILLGAQIRRIAARHLS